LVDKELLDILRLKEGRLYHREGTTLEFKEQFNFAGLAEYFRDFVAFSNNRGGFLVFGVTDSPRTLKGLSAKAVESFEKIDPEEISQLLGENFSSEIKWEAATIRKDGRCFAGFKVFEAVIKPVIATKDAGRDQAIRNGDIYYRYGGRTQRIMFGELQAIINDRIESNNRAWIEHVQQIGASGPHKSMVVSTEDQMLQKQSGPMMIDRSLAKKLQFIKEGTFDEKKGATALKLVGDVVPVDAIEVEKTIEENVFYKYPYSATETLERVKSEVPGAKQQVVWKLIAENNLKGDPRYSKFNFRNRAQEEKYQATGKVPTATPVIYNENAVNFLVNLLKSS